ncbi:glycosyltransferase family 2 protein [Methanobrevibacter sp. DSM 116169]|uniref:glycosyltransferase family 2 protein n=1 Tax=Methanobrevibacter sp. DSM 116169 TaxID=3242727 RepID=UPI0038FC5E88
MDEIIVSVIVPIYNSSHTLEKTLNSIIHQKFENYEIIVIDDGSTDDSLDKSYETLSKSSLPYQIIHQKNKGASVARNNGLEVAKGEYILFVDSDDYINKDQLSFLHNAVIRNETDFAFSELLKMKGRELASHDNPYGFLKNNQILKSIDLIKLELEMKIPFSFTQILYKTSILKENNIKFNETYKYGEDTDFALRALFSIDTISFVDLPGYYYLLHDDSSSSKLYLNRFKVIDVFESLTDYFSKNNTKYSDEEIKQLNNLIIYNRIPKAIFGNLMHFFNKNYNLDEITNEMKKLNLFSKLSKFKIASFKDIKFWFKSKAFLISPKIYYKLWKEFKGFI